MATSAENCQRAFTLFTTAHDNVRRVTSFLRWHHDDLDEIAPTLYGKDARRKSNDTIPPSPTPRLPNRVHRRSAEQVQTAISSAVGKRVAVGVGLPESEPFVGR